MKLPEPARTLWTRHREAIEQIATTPGAESRIMLGGGTLLAARWNHRESTDIDVLLPDRDNLNDARENGPLDLAAATGGEHKGSSRDRLRVELETGMLDMAATRPQMPGLEERVDVEGRNETVLASAQILRGNSAAPTGASPATRSTSPSPPTRTRAPSRSQSTAWT